MPPRPDDGPRRAPRRARARLAAGGPAVAALAAAHSQMAADRDTDRHRAAGVGRGSGHAPGSCHVAGSGPVPGMRRGRGIRPGRGIGSARGIDRGGTAGAAHPSCDPHVSGLMAVRTASVDARPTADRRAGRVATDGRPVAGRRVAGRAALDRRAAACRRGVDRRGVGRQWAAHSVDALPAIAYPAAHAACRSGASAPVVPRTHAVARPSFCRPGVCGRPAADQPRVVSGIRRQRWPSRVSSTVTPLSASASRSRSDAAQSRAARAAARSSSRA